MKKILSNFLRNTPQSRKSEIEERIKKDFMWISPFGWLDYKINQEYEVTFSNEESVMNWSRFYQEYYGVCDETGKMFLAQAELALDYILTTLTNFQKVK